MSPRLHVIVAGHTVVTDLGRSRGPGYGMPVNGALDQQSARVANTLAGNRANAPLLELTAFDFAARPDADILVAVAGARALVSVDGIPHPQCHPVLVGAGQVLSVSSLHDGLRAYVAVFGGFDAPRLLDSCAPDTVLGFGMRLVAGKELDLLRAAPDVTQPTLGIPLFHFDAPRPGRAHPLVVDVVDGPDIADFGDTVDRLFSAAFRVGQSSNHVGLRFEGNPPVRVTKGEILSRGVPVGAVEVPAGTEVLVLHRGRGVTAGYPVLGVVPEPGLDLLGQVRPGEAVRFRQCTIADATARTRARRREVESLAAHVASAYSSLDAFASTPGNDRWSLFPAPHSSQTPHR
jgi:5-oxoprolinase (ATP-hydrolysing) subunit C